MLLSSKMHMLFLTYRTFPPLLCPRFSPLLRAIKQMSHRQRPWALNDYRNTRTEDQGLRNLYLVVSPLLLTKACLSFEFALVLSWTCWLIFLTNWLWLFCLFFGQLNLPEAEVKWPCDFTLRFFFWHFGADWCPLPCVPYFCFVIKVSFKEDSTLESTILSSKCALVCILQALTTGCGETTTVGYIDSVLKTPQVHVV